jgi:hypothetical protein
LTRLNIARITAFILACGVLSYSVLLVGKGWGLCFSHDFRITDYKVQQAIVWSVWTIATPLWFLFEYYLFNKSYPDPPDSLLKRFKNNQELASKCWLAVAAVLLALYFGRDMRP